MKYYTMVDMARILKIPESSARGYRDRYPSYMTTTGEGRGKRYTEEALEALRISATMSREGIPHEDIESALEARFGIAVESQESRVSQPQTVVSSSRTVAAMMTPEELTGLFKQAMQEVTAPLHSEIAALRNELAEAQLSRTNEIKAMEARQVEREAAHYNLVDEHLKTLAEESRKGFWARLFKK